MNPCGKCRRLLGFTEGSSATICHDDNGASMTCSVCLGIWSKNFAESLLDSIKGAMAPYNNGNSNNNRFSRTVSAPMVHLPGDVVYRFQVAAKPGASPGCSVQDFVHELKHYTKSLVNTCFDEIEREQTTNVDCSYPPCIALEELGYLAVHVVVLPTSDVARPLHRIPKRKESKKGRRRNLHEDSQGGDPRCTMERRLEQDGSLLWSLNQALESSSTAEIPSGKGNDSSQLLQLQSSNTGPALLQFHTTVWRRPFYLRGVYTKTRRDVSQTPFHVVDEGQRRKLGETSVEEEITPAIVRACGGISTLNNEDTLSSNNHLVFGMAKFHASGREDIDVRMLLPENNTIDTSSSSPLQALVSNITGRPFVYEIYDALKMPLPSDLGGIVSEVNHNADQNDNAMNSSRSYGKNLNGVGISHDLTFVASSSFKKLQEETEDKIKHYGCLSWSEKVLPATDKELLEKLGTFPLEIHQRTPIRVLHRRANTVRIRHVLSCRVRRIDDHYFRLNISTSAGTYVKEFVHGDLGRTIPSVSTLLSCSTDILELDCEGIQF